MDLEDAYFDFPELMTSEEKEENDFDEYGDNAPQVRSFPGWYFKRDSSHIIPDEEGRQYFEKRKPALGFSIKQIDLLEAHSNDPALLPVQKRILFNGLKSELLRSLISTDGSTTTSELLEILRGEVRTNIPSPVPTWYEWSKVKLGPRRIGYQPCACRGCSRTETLLKSFSRCSSCKLAFYYGKDCQGSDWNTRHKKICKAAAKKRKQYQDVGSMLQMMGDGHR